MQSIPLNYLRRLTKELTFLAPLLIIAVIFLNASLKKTEFENAREILAHNSGNARLHLVLGSNFLTTNQLSVAKREFNLALKFQGLSTQERMDVQKKIEEVKSLQSMPDQIKHSLQLWKKITDQYPSYRDGQIKLALLNWDLYRSFESEKYFRVAGNLDPNNEDIKKMVLSLK